MARMWRGRRWLSDDEFQEKRESLGYRRRRYKEYMASEEWASFRLSAILNAGGRCQHSPDLIPGWEGYEAKRCVETCGLQVHHIHYLTVGFESFGDVEVLCRKHHEARELAKLQCRNCLSYLYSHPEDIEALQQGMVARGLSFQEYKTLAPLVCYACEEWLASCGVPVFQGGK